MRSVRSLRVLVALALLPLTAMANPVGAGLRLTDLADDWSPWQARLAIASSAWQGHGAASPWTLTGVRLSGERFFPLGRVGDGGGLRAGGALLLGSPTAALGAASPRSDEWLSWRSLGAAQVEAPDFSATPYVGLGYSAWWARSGLGLSADLGLLAQRPGQALRSLTGGSGLDNTVRALQLSPVFQVNLSFSF